MVKVPGVAPVTRTGSPYPTFGIIRPAVPNTRVDMSPYGQSVFADAIDAIQSVDLAFDALINEVDAGKMRVFLSDVMFDREKDAKGRNVPIPFGKGDCTVFRKVMSTEDTISEFAPALRTDAQSKALRLALQVLGDRFGLGINYFDFDNVGYVKTATEISADNSALMRNIKKHGNALAGTVADVAHATMACARALGEEIPPEGEVGAGWTGLAQVHLRHLAEYPRQPLTVILIRQAFDSIPHQIGIPALWGVLKYLLEYLARPDDLILSCISQQERLGSIVVFRQGCTQLHPASLHIFEALVISPGALGDNRPECIGVHRFPFPLSAVGWSRSGKTVVTLPLFLLTPTWTLLYVPHMVTPSGTFAFDLRDTTYSPALTISLVVQLFGNQACPVPVCFHRSLCLGTLPRRTPFG